MLLQWFAVCSDHQVIYSLVQVYLVYIIGRVFKLECSFHGATFDWSDLECVDFVHDLFH